MKHQKKILALPLPEPPEVDISTGIKSVWGYFDGQRTPDDFVYRADIVTVEGDDVLQLTAFFGTVVKWRLSILGRQYILQIYRGNINNPDLSCATIGNKLYYDFDSWGRYWCTADTAQTVREYIGLYWDSVQIVHMPDPLSLVNRYQQMIGKLNLEEDHRRGKERIDQLMNQVPAEPKNFRRWIDNGPLLSERYGFYHYQDRKRVTVTCSHCQQDFETDRPHHGDIGTCPHCKSKIMFKSFGKREHIRYDCHCALIQRIEGATVYRYFDVMRRFEKHSAKPWTTIHEQYRTVSFDDPLLAPKHFIWKPFKQYGACRWCVDGNHYRTKAHIYPSNLRKAFDPMQAERLKYFPIIDFVKSAGELYPEDFAVQLIRRPQTEFLYKLGFKRLTTDIVNGYTADYDFSQKRIDLLFGINKSDVPAMRKLDPSIHEIKIFKAGRIRGLAAAIETVTVYRNMSPKIQASQYLDLLQYASAPLIARYVQEQKEHIQRNWYSSHVVHVAQEWLDYIGMARLCDLDLKDRFILAPKNLKEAHDQIQEQVKLMDSNGYPQIARMEQEINQKYAWQRGSYLIRAPHDGKEIITEGNKLRHCVHRAGYDKRMARGETLILFVREISDPDKPFYTMEFKNGVIKQLYGYKDKRANKQVQAFADAWLRQINSRNLKMEFCG